MAKIRMRDGQYVHVRILGQGKPIVLLHGFGMQSLHWLPFVIPLSFKHQIILPDLRGFGSSHHVSHNQDCIINNYVEDLVDIADHLGLDQFKLGGISMGALTGLKFTSENPGRVSEYLHIDQAPRCINSANWNWGLFGTENEVRLRRAQSLLDELQPYADNAYEFKEVPSHLQQALWRELGDFFASALSKPIQKNLARRLCRYPALATKLMPTDNWPVYIHCLRAYIDQDYDLLADLPDVQTPISLIIGIKSEMYPCGGQLRIADYAPNCRVVPFTDSGHAPLLDQPFKLMQELTRLAKS